MKVDIWGLMIEQFFSKYGETSGFTSEPDQFFLFERDDGYTYRSSIYTFFTRKFNEWSLAERGAVKKAFGNVLDVGCGSGRVSLWLQEQGLSVKAIDISDKCVQVSRARGLVDVELQDVYEMNFPRNSFDTVLILGTGGLLINKTSLRQLINPVLKVLRPGGQIIGASCYWLPNPVHDAYKEEHGVLVTGRLKYLSHVDDWEPALQFDIDEFRTHLPNILRITDIFEGAYIEDRPFVQWSFIVRRK